MCEPTRFDAMLDPYDGFACMEPRPDGDYVTWSAHEELKAENERLRSYESEWERLLNEQRKQLDAARELLDLVRDTVNDAANDAKRDTRKVIYKGQVSKIDAWLEANK